MIEGEQAATPDLPWGGKDTTVDTIRAFRSPVF
jgi:hypothetical protein